MLNCKNLPCLLGLLKTAFNPFQKSVCDSLYPNIPFCASAGWVTKLYYELFVVTIEHCQQFATGPSSSKFSGAELSLYIVTLVANWSG